MVNKVMLLGRLGADPKLNDKKVANVSLATTEKGYTAKDGTKIPEKTEWHNLSMFGTLAETACKYLKKGDMLFVEGKLSTYTYEKNGEKRFYTSVVVSEMRMLSKRGGDASGTTSAPSPSMPTEKEDDLPF